MPAHIKRQTNLISVKKSPVIYLVHVRRTYNMYIIHMGAALTELYLLGSKTEHSQVGHNSHRFDRSF